MVVTCDLKIRSFKAKLPLDYGSMIEVTLDSKTFNFATYYRGSPIYTITEDSILIAGSYPKATWKRLWFKVKEQFWPSKIRIKYFTYKTLNELTIK